MFDVVWSLFRSFLCKFFDVFSWNKQDTIMNSLRINIRVGTDMFVPLEVDPKWTIGEVKQKLAPKVNCTPQEIRVIFAGQELDNSIVVEDCDIGQQSIIHVFKGVRKGAESDSKKSLISNVLRQKLTLTDGDLRMATCSEEMKRVHFFVYCTSPCKNVCHGKLRVRCAKCKLGTLTVNQDPCCWDDVLLPERIQGVCHSEGCEGNLAELFFICANHSSSNDDTCVSL